MYVDMLNRILWWTLLVYAVFFSNISAHNITYNTFYMDELCSESGIAEIHMDSGNGNSTGILKASRDGRYLKNVNCRISLKSSSSKGTVASIRYIDLRPQDSCDNYLQVYPTTELPVSLCGFNFDMTESQSFFNLNNMDLDLHTKLGQNHSSIPKISQFEIIFTAVGLGWAKSCHENDFICRNGRCIWEGLKNDGHNNCGDSSDEHSFDYLEEETKLSAATTLAVIIPIIVLSLALLVILFYCFGNRLTAKIERLIQDEQRRQEDRNSLVCSGPGSRRDYRTAVFSPENVMPIAQQNEANQTSRIPHTVTIDVNDVYEDDFNVLDNIWEKDKGPVKDDVPPYEWPPSYSSVSTPQKF